MITDINSHVQNSVLVVMDFPVTQAKFLRDEPNLIYVVAATLPIDELVSCGRLKTEKVSEQIFLTQNTGTT